LNRTESYRILVKGNIRDVDIRYYGDLYREEKIKNKPAPVISRSALPVVEAKQKNLLKPTPYPCIKQPIPGININDTLYSFDAAYAQLFYYESGSNIQLDQDVFIDSAGKNYSGPVSLFYREFRYPVEIMLSGILMKTSVGGEEKLFKSGGIYKIRAFDRNGKELQTRCDTSVKINFALTDTSSEFQFFR